MATVTLDHLDEELFARIDKLARAKQTTVEDAIVSVLRDVLPGRSPTLLEQADAIAALTPPDVVQTDSTLLIREDRDR
jgi:hypothetical protein